MVVPVKSKKTVTSQTMQLAKIFSRRKQDDGEDEGEAGGTKLARVLGLADLTMLGVGSTLGVGVYVLAGAVAKTDAGPAVTISFLIAAVASAFAGLCYAEFAARVPKAGSAYVYSYVTVGELCAFIIGWNLILEYAIGTASVARGLSNYIDSMTNYAMSSALTEVMPINVSWLSAYPDFLSCGCVLILSMLLAWGVKESSFMNNIFTAVNLCTVVLVIVAGSFFIDFHNWDIPASEIPAVDSSGAKIDGGAGGFLPFGFSGVMAGAAKCFYGFVGFDCVATTGEEAINPKRDIPLSIIISLIIIFFAYFGIAGVLTLMWPYYLQDPNAPLPYVFDQVNLPVIKYIVTVGAIIALCTSLLGAMFPLPRVLYAMASDGLLYDWMRLLHPTTKTPVLATLASGIFAGIVAAIFNLEQLIDMMSIGTLLAYTIVAFCVLVLRYRDPHPVMFESSMLPGSASQGTAFTALKDVLNLAGLKYPSRTSEYVSLCALAAYIVLTAIICILLRIVEDSLVEGQAWAIAITSSVVALMLIAVIVLCRQPKAEANLSFKVPFVPVLPCVSIFINFYLMAKLDIHTWIRFIVWLFIGMLIYVFYSIPNSVAGQRLRRAETSASTTKETTKI